MLKKILAVVMTGAMVLALSVPAFAETIVGYDAAEGSNGTDSESSAFDVTVGMKTPTLKIGVGSGAGVVFNPSQMVVGLTDALLGGSVASAGASALSGTTQDQVISNETSITNFSNVPVRMYAKGVATEGIDGVEFTDGSIDDNETAKKIHLFCEVISQASESPKLTDENDSNDYTSYYVEQMESDEDLQRRQGWDGRKNQIRISNEDRDDFDNEGDYVMVFEAASNVYSATAPTINDNVNNSAAKGKMKFFGSMTKNPTTPWSATDNAVKFTLTMKFVMQANEVEES